MTAPGASLGVVMLAHAALGRAEQAVRFWAAAGCPVVVHVDAAVPAVAFDAFREALRDLPSVVLSPRRRCEWGTWGIVAATLEASETMLGRFPGVSHVFLASGSCLPLRPVAALAAHLAAHPGADFIESATTADVPWTVGGLSEERFTLRFPFAWRRHRRLFDAAVALQRRLGLRRRVPAGLVPHLGSQWWCLTRATLGAILRDPARPRLDRWFRQAWIPDESYFQTLARRQSLRIESRSLTLSRFDGAGRPHVFYDDHLPLLRRSGCFVARKAWPGADGLYRAFLSGEGPQGVEPAPGKIDRVLARAAERRSRGRAGLWMQSRLPRDGRGDTAAPYAVFEGFAELFEGWEPWLARATGLQVHGHLFAQARVEFEGRGATFAGALSDSPHLRDHDPRMFLRNLLWNTRGQRQAFQWGPHDRQHLSWDIACDPNAVVAVISGAWAIPLFRERALGAGTSPGTARRMGADGRRLGLRAEAAWRQKVEAEHLAALRSPQARARVRVWTLAEVLEDPAEAVRVVLGDLGQGGAPRPAEAPPVVDLRGFGRFLQDLRNDGMHPHLTGDVPADAPLDAPALAPFLVLAPARRAYLAR